MGIAVVTARNHLKAVFAKTGAHRQSELVALLAALEAGVRGVSCTLFAAPVGDVLCSESIEFDLAA
jgi:hypothetical protein